ncbi:hypothetical protein [Bacillus andreraoultii]|uniref:hypothetical protein n=1 Tax=Bacillus andreraoultii TaxID=1499685 RepID=UPI00053ABBE0|nr:hypothetical protein [Bacillus andreraoultii]
MKKSSIYIYASLLFILFFDLWVENSEQAKKFFGFWIEPLVDEPKFSVVWTILIIVAIIIYFKNKIDEKEEDRRELEKTLESEMAILVMANKELNKYRLQDNLMIILNKFVQQNAYVNAVQWYHYEENNIHGQTKFKLNYQYGSVVEEVNLNAVQQIYYQCDTSTLKEFRKAKRIYNIEGNPELLVEFIIKVYNMIANKKDNMLTQKDAVLCSLMIISFEIIEKDYGLVFEEFSGPNARKFQKLIDNNRIGILRAALMEDEYYSFTHTRENEKFNRQYISRLVKAGDESVVFTIVLDSSILEEEKYESLMLNIAMDFEKLLKNLEKLYNRNNEGAGE